MPQPSKIAWIDLETTCSDETQRHAAIIEYGLVVTDMQLDPIMSTSIVINPALDKSYRSYINEHDLPDELTVEETLEGVFSRMEPIVQGMHTNNGLWDEVVKSDWSPQRADEALCDVWNELAPDGSKLVLAGSGVGHFDSRFLRKFLPQSSSRLTYYTYDVGVVRRFLRDLSGVDVTVADAEGKSSGEGKTHRALDDVWAHLREARTYVDALRGLAL